MVSFGKSAIWQGEMAMISAPPHHEPTLEIRLQLPVIAPLWVATLVTASATTSGLKIVNEDGSDLLCPRETLLLKDAQGVVKEYAK